MCVSRGEGMSEGHRAPNGQKRNNSSNKTNNNGIRL